MSDLAKIASILRECRMELAESNDKAEVKMSGCFGRSSEDRVRETELHSYLERQYGYDTYVAQEVDALTAPDGEYYAFKPENLEQAMTELPRADLLNLAIYLQSNNALAATKLLRDHSMKYWIKMAEVEAEKHWGESHESNV